ncbi:hypothetical protein F9K91_21235 [Brucella tritici]|uniref:Uncharacterized protein n=1 Tax=Brucella tritici TaxID=94626 RepID=A0A7X6FNV3_9HYPH|nr:hypothetical protein [Brucella tritici]KAB2662762.1 hypothetical protein F9K91_21235 [Brucella tritici]NKW09113.1 hypothetical protein [Brucella tritici]
MKHVKEVWEEGRQFGLQQAARKVAEMLKGVPTTAKRCMDAIMGLRRENVVDEMELGFKPMDRPETVIRTKK